MTSKQNHQNFLTDDLFFSIIHDLKNMMVPIVTRSEMLQLPGINEEKRAYLLDQMNKSCSQMLHALNQIVEVFRYQGDFGVGECRKMKLNYLVAELYDVMEEDLNHKEIRFYNEIAPDCEILSRQDSVRIILSNLAGNALKFTARGGEIRISAREVAGGWRVTVKDSGIGIDEARIAGIVNDSRYFTTQGTEGEAGTGFGIMLCASLLKHYGSALEFANNPEGGASFSFVVPKATE